MCRCKEETVPLIIVQDFSKKLPYELAVEVFRCLIKDDSKTLIQLTTVCASWRHFLLSSTVFWKHLSFTGDTPIEKMDIWYSRAGQNVTSLTIDCWRKEHVEQLYKQFRGWEALDELTVNLHWNTPFIPNHVHPLLRPLTLNIWCLSETNPCRVSLLQMNMDRLVALKLQHVKDLACLRSLSCPSLRTFELAGAFTAQTESLHAFLGANSTIETLILSNDYGVGDFPMLFLRPVALPNLRSLSVRCPYGVPSQWLQTFVMPAVEAICINVFQLSVLYDHFKEAPPKQLKRARISVLGVTEPEFERLAKALPNVEELELSCGSKSGMNVNLSSPNVEPLNALLRCMLVETGLSKKLRKIELTSFNENIAIDNVREWRKRSGLLYL